MSDWLRGPLLGALLGLPILGGGGRLAMHAIAVSTDAQHSVSVQGTITVLLAGIAAGIAGGTIYSLLARVLPARRAVRDALFAAALVALTLRGLHPVQPLAFALFMPIVLLYGVALERAWHARPHSTRTIDA